MTISIEKCIPPAMVAPKFHGLPKIHKIGAPSGSLSPVGGPSHIGWPRYWPTSSISLFGQSPHYFKNTQTLCATHEGGQTSSLGRSWHFIMSWHSSPQVPMEPFHQHSKTKTTTGSTTLTKDQHVHTTNSYTSGVLP